MARFYLILADAILVSHALIVLFNVASLPAIWLGHFLKWRFVRNFWFRIIHLILIAYIAVQALVGRVCPLTDWENLLREKAGAEAQYAGGFFAHWVQGILFYEADERVFTVAYVAFFILVLATFYWVKPAPPAFWRSRSH